MSSLRSARRISGRRFSEGEKRRPEIRLPLRRLTSETFWFTFHLFTQWHKVGLPSLSESASLLFCFKVADYIPKNKLILLASHPPNMFVHSR